MSKTYTVALTTAIDKLQNEGGNGYQSYAQRYAGHDEPTAEQRVAKIAQIDAEFAAEWSSDVTAARRALWNKIALANPGKNPPAIDKSIKFNIYDLKKAIVLNALNA